MADGTHSFVADQQNWNQRVTTEVEAPRQWAETWGPIFQEEKKGVDNLAEGVRLREEFYSSRIEKLEAELKECVTGRPCLRCDAPPPPPLSNAAAAAAAAYAAAAKHPRHAPAARSPARAPAYPPPLSPLSPARARSASARRMDKEGAPTLQTTSMAYGCAPAFARVGEKNYGKVSDPLLGGPTSNLS